MSKSVGAEPVERRHRSGADKAVEEERDAVAARGQRGAHDGGELAAAEGGGDAQRIVEDEAVAGERGVDDFALSFQAEIVDAGAAAGPALAAAAEQGGRD